MKLSFSTLRCVCDIISILLKQLTEVDMYACIVNKHDWIYNLKERNIACHSVIIFISIDL